MKYYRNGQYEFRSNKYWVYEIPKYGGEPVLEGFRKTEQECEDLIDTFI